MCGGGNVKSITHNIQQMSFQTKQQPFSTTALCQKAPRTLFSKSPRRWLQWYFWSSQRETQFNPAVHTMHVLLGSWMSTKKKSWTLTTHDRYLSVGTNHLGRRSVFAINIHCSCTILSCFHIASTKGAKLTADYPNTMQHDDHSMVPAHHSHTTHTHIHTPHPYLHLAGTWRSSGSVQAYVIQSRGYYCDGLALRDSYVQKCIVNFLDWTKQ